MSTINRTFSIPLDVDGDLHALVKRRNMSRFVADSLRKSLKELSNDLRDEYRMANKDEGQREAEKDWESTIPDGLGKNNDW
jgi:hypothetical protein